MRNGILWSGQRDSHQGSKSSVQGTLCSAMGCRAARLAVLGSRGL